MRRLLGKLGVAFVVVTTVMLFLPSAVGADSIGPITFEYSQGYILGDINNQPLIPGSLPNGAW
jgi:hypothetical protein